MEKILVHGESAQERWNFLEYWPKNATEKVCGWSKDRNEETLDMYKVLKKEVRREVASAMESRWIEMANELEKGDSTMAFRIAKQRAKKKEI